MIVVDIGFDYKIKWERMMVMSKKRNNSLPPISKRDSDILLDYIRGTKVQEILLNYKIHTQTLYNLLDTYGIPKKSHEETQKRYSREIFKRVVRERQSVASVADELRLPVEVVRAFIQKEYSAIDQQKKKSVQVAPPVSKPKTGLGKDGLIGHLPSSNKPGLSISQTYEDVQKRESVEDDKVSEFADMLGEGFDDEEKLKLSLLRALLKHASEHTDMVDYSEDSLLLPDYLLPIDLVIMKDMTKRSVEGEKVRKIASAHRTDERLVSDLLTKGLDRHEFRERFIKSLVDRGLIQF